MAQKDASTKERNYNTLNTAYFLPNDEAEWERLNWQHDAFVIGMDGLVICPDIVDACLVPNGETPPRVLDLGMLWIRHLFSHAYVLGLDLVAPPSTQSLPPNVQFETYDVNQGLSKFYSSFNVVHAKVISNGIKDYRLMMEEAEKCLLPGGVVIFMDFDGMFVGEDQIHRHPMAESIDGEGGKGSWLVRCMHEMLGSGPMRQSDLLGMGKCLDEGLWGHELLDPETAHAASFFVPIGPWASGPDEETTQKLQLAGSLMREDFKNAFNVILDVFPRLGAPQEVAEEWRPKVAEELETTALHIWMRMRNAWARRRAAPGKPAPPLPNVLSGASIGGQNVMQKYTSQLNQFGGPAAGTKKLEKVEWVHHYKAQEESLRAAKIRDESLGPLPVPWALRKEQT